MPETKTPILSPLELLAGALASVTAAVVGSLFGDSGTLAGVALGSVVLSASAAVYKHVAHKAPTLLGKAPAVKPRHVGWALLSAGAAAAVAFAAITATEAAAGQTLHGITTGTVDRGTTLGGSVAPGPSPARHPHRRRRHHRPVPHPTPSLSLTPSPSPSPTPAAPSVIVTPPPTMPPPSSAPASPSPSVSPTVSAASSLPG